jgi:hypothetical protein
MRDDWSAEKVRRRLEMWAADLRTESELIIENLSSASESEEAFRVFLEVGLGIGADDIGAEIDEIHDEPRKCRVCGCTDDNCQQCVEKTDQPCHWVEPTLCSTCSPEVA